MFFINKYAVKHNYDLCFNQKVNETLNILSDDPSLQHIILYGPEGSGKKTLTNLFLQQLYNKEIFDIRESIYDIDNNSSKIEIPVKQSKYHLVINANTIKNNNSLLQIINKYTSLYHYVNTDPKKFNEIVIYDIDKLPNQIQLALRRVMEETTDHHRYIFTCSKLTSIIDPIISRCTILKTYPPSNKDLIDVIMRITTAEHYLIKYNEMQYVIQRSENNISRCLIYLESLIKKYKINDDYLQTIHEIIKLIQTKKINELTKINDIRSDNYNILSSHISCNQIIKDILIYFMNSNYSIEIKKKIIKLSSNYDINCLQCTNKNILICNYIGLLIIILNENNT